MPTLNIPKRISEITLPPIDLIKRLASRLDRMQEVIDLGQDTSGFLPPESVIVKVRQAVLERKTSFYSDDPGFMELRQALAGNLRKENKLSYDGSNIIITPGANQAFMTTISTLLEPGDEVILPSPYYYNHATAVIVANGIIIESPCKDDFSLDTDDIRSKINEKTKAIVIVTPNNPTGAVYTEESLRELAEIIAENPHVALISDETYRHFVYDGAKHFSIGSIEEIVDNVITIGSFSKSYGLSGWRVGYIATEDLVLKDILKVHDTASICAPVISQVAALEALTPKSYDYVKRMIRRIEDLRNYAFYRLKEIEQIGVVKTNGAYYIFPKILVKHKAKNTNNLAMDILKSVHVVTIPGTSFSSTVGKNYMRINYSSVTRDKLEEAFDRLADYFKRITQ